MLLKGDKNVCQSIVGPLGMSGVESWEYKRIFKEIEQVDADWLVFCGRGNIEFIQWLKRIRPKTKIAVWDPDEVLFEHHNKSVISMRGQVDLLIQEHQGIVKKYRNVVRSVWLPACFERCMEPTSNEKVYEVGFLGYVDDYRAGVLQRLTSQIPGKHMIWNSSTMGILRGVDVGNFHAKCKVIIGVPRVPERATICATSNRIFMVLGVGTMYLNNITPGISCLFTPGVHFDEWCSEEDLLIKTRLYLSNDELREKIAEAGRQEVYAKHLSEYRAEEFWDIMERSLISKS